MSGHQRNASVIRRALDLLFKLSGGVAVAFLMMIAVLTVSQVVARVFGQMIPSADDFAGFCMAGAVFIGLAHTLRAGGHVRVLVVLTHMTGGARRVAEMACSSCAAAIVALLTFYTADMIITTRQLGEYTLGLIPVPKWIPMLLMLIGLLVFLLALIDEFVRAATGGQPLYAQREEDPASITASAE
jgi:TRAP-type C4-dicarboxylate transport system permease small subunit